MVFLGWCLTELEYWWIPLAQLNSIANSKPERCNYLFPINNKCKLHLLLGIQTALRYMALSIIGPLRWDGKYSFSSNIIRRHLTEVHVSMPLITTALRYSEVCHLSWTLRWSKKWLYLKHFQQSWMRCTSLENFARTAERMLSVLTFHCQQMHHQSCFLLLWTLILFLILLPT